MKRSSYLQLKLALFFLFFCLIASVSRPCDAASFTRTRPRLNIRSAYMNNAVYLKWNKVGGAKKYEIQRAWVNPKRRNTVGKWKRWAVTRNTSIRKRAVGDYRYRVRAISGNKTSLWSASKRIFGANGVITNVVYEKPMFYIFGGTLNFRVLITNRTQSQMGFVKTGSQSTIYAIDTGTNQVVKTWPGHLYIAESYGYAKQVNPRKQQSVYFYCSMDEDEYEQYKNYKFMVTASFYPNPWVEPISTVMAVACTTNVAESAIAGK